MEKRQPTSIYRHGSLADADHTLNNLLDLIAEGTWDWCRQTGVVLRSPGWYRMLGYQQGQFKQDVFTWENLIHPEDYSRVMRNFERFCDGQIDTYSIDYRCRKSDGSWLWITDNALILERGDSGQVTRILGAHLDIHERKLAQLELVEQNRLLREDNVELERRVVQKARELEQKNRQLQLKIEEVERISNTDLLTRIANRKKFDEVLRNEISRSDRYGHELSLAIFDIDYFKHVNDSLGHEIGDQVLKNLAAFVAGNIRDIDFFGRWGGEEFVLIFPDVALGDAILGAEKLRRLIAQQEFYPGLKITCSFGVTDYRSGEAVDKVFNRIDNALYLAKSAGRNQVIQLPG